MFTIKREIIDMFTDSLELTHISPELCILNGNGYIIRPLI